MKQYYPTIRAVCGDDEAGLRANLLCSSTSSSGPSLWVRQWVTIALTHPTHHGTHCHVLARLAVFLAHIPCPSPRSNPSSPQPHGWRAHRWPSFTYCSSPPCPIHPSTNAGGGSSRRRGSGRQVFRAYPSPRASTCPQISGNYIHQISVGFDLCCSAPRTC